MAIEQIQLDELVDPFEAKLNVYRGDDGTVTEVAFDLSGLPRIDSMLIGKRALDVPDITKRLCGLCPVVHHLAGVRAVEDLFGITEIPHTATLIRELLCAGSILDSLATKFVATDRDTARLIKRASQAVLRAAGAPTHFPDVAIPGGVRRPADAALVEAAKSALAELMDSDTFAEWSAINATADSRSDGESAFEDNFAGLDIAVVDANGDLNPLGGCFGVTDRHSGERWVFPATQWTDRVNETAPGEAAPRPTFSVNDISEVRSKITSEHRSENVGQDSAQPRHYRVGPLSRQAVVGKRGMSPHEAQLRLLVDTAEAAQAILADSDLLGEEVGAEGAEEAITKADFAGVRTGVGVIDGPRGLLVHKYTAAADGIITDCQIMTPTAQNELWLTQMLTARLAGHSSAGEDGIEESIWAADPCLPCSSAPAGVMSFKFQDQGQDTSGPTETTVGRDSTEGTR